MCPNINAQSSGRGKCLKEELNMNSDQLPVTKVDQCGPYYEDPNLPGPRAGHVVDLLTNRLCISLRCVEGGP